MIPTEPSHLALPRFADRLIDPSATDAEAVEAAWSDLIAASGGEVEASTRQRLTLLDTFDWRLYRRGEILVLEPGALVWRRLDADDSAEAGIVLRRLPRTRRKAPAFAEDLEPGPFRDALAARIAPRRLLPIVELEVERQVWTVLGDERKTVARLERIEATTSGGDPLPTRLRLLPLRGYGADAERIGRGLETVGVAAGSSLWRSALAQLGALGGRAPGGYRPKERVVSDPSMRSDEALRAILRKQFAVMRETEDGVIRDLDSEFLHDYRVALRRSRSALQQLAKALPQDAVAHFKSELRWLGQATGPLRDLDVYQLKLPAYRAALPAGDAAALEPLAQHIASRRRTVHTELVRTLRGSRVATLYAAWSRLIGGDDPADTSWRQGWSGDAPWAARPIGQTAANRIAKRYRRLIEDGASIQPDTPDEAIHDLRIDGKKLRYLLEFFGDLYPRDLVVDAISALKRLQDHLGDFNDYSVQREALRHFAEELQGAEELQDAGGRRGAGPATLLALGGLLSHLRQAQFEERTPILAQLKAFGGPSVRARFARLA